MYIVHLTKEDNMVPRIRKMKGIHGYLSINVSGNEIIIGTWFVRDTRYTEEETCPTKQSLLDLLLI